MTYSNLAILITISIWTIMSFGYMIPNEQLLIVLVTISLALRAREAKNTTEETDMTLIQKIMVLLVLTFLVITIFGVTVYGWLVLPYIAGMVAITYVAEKE